MEKDNHMVTRIESAAKVRSASLWPVLVVWIIVLSCGLLLLLHPERISSLTLIMAGAVVILLILRICAHRKTGLSLLHPVVYLSLSYYIPQFIIMPLIQWLDWDPNTFIPGLGNEALFYFNLSEVVGIGSLVCLCVGFYLSFGRRIARHLPSLDRWDWPPKSLGTASFVMYLLIGIPIIIFQIVYGHFTYSGEFNVGIDTIFNYLQFFRHSSLFLVWFCYWRSGRRTSLRAPLLVTGVELTMAVISGSRGRLMINLLVIMMSYFVGSKKRVSLKKGITVFGPVLAIALVAGVLLGTIFRGNKVAQAGLDTGTSLSQAIQYSILSFRQVGEMSLGSQLLSFSKTMMSRIDGQRNLGLILAYADQYKMMEESRGMSNNILRELSWSLIPRALYPNKPIVGDIANKYAMLYGGSGPIQSSAMTVMGDLYRNFKLIGVAIGMALIGILMRIMYDWLKPVGHPGAAAALLFTIWLLFQLGLESNYSALLVNLPRTGAVMLAVLLILKALLSILSDKHTSPPRNISALTRPNGAN